MSKTLYIIGNGFDVFHGLPTSYGCFLCFMLKKYPSDAQRLGFIFNRTNSNKLWADFENELGTFDVLELVKRNIDNWLHVANQNKFANLFADVHCQLQTFFHEWVEQIPMGMDNRKRLTLADDALFLNFNYTNTLEEFYHISSTNICHIHGDTLQNNLIKPIVGHSRTNNCVEKDKCKVCNFIRVNNIYPKWAGNAEHFAEIVIEELNDLWDGLAKESKVQHIDGEKVYTIKANGLFFEKCCNLNDIYIMGCSLGIADKDYFTEIFEKSPNARWHISKYNKTDEELKSQLAGLIGIDKKNINIDTFNMDSLLVETNEETHIMKQVFFAQPMEESIMGKEIYEVVRRGVDGNLYPTPYQCMSKDAAIEKAKELNKEYNSQI